MNVPTAVWVLLAFFLASSLIHLFFCFREMEKWRAYSKPLCVLLLALIALVWRQDQWLIYVGALFGVAGDILLIKKHEKPYFAAGTIAFFMGHVCYIAEMIILLENAHLLNWVYGVCFAIVYVILVVVSYRLSYKTTKSRLLGAVSAFYVAILVSVFLISLVGMILGFSIWLLMVADGGLAFICSDSILAVTTFVKDVKRRDFYIMIPYLLGEAFIVFGLLLSVAGR